MKRLSLLLLVLLLAIPGSALALNIGLSDVIETLEKPFRSDTPTADAIANFQADFFQQSRLASLDREQRGQGRVEVAFDRQASGKVPRVLFRWEYDQPNNQEIVSDGETLWVYLPENNQVIQSDVSFTRQSSSEDPMTFLTGLGNLSRDFQIGWASPNHDNFGNFVLQLRPRRSSALIREMRITVERRAVQEFVESGTTGQRLPILSSTVTDPNDNTTTIEFSDPRVNTAIFPGDFRFILPPGVDVVRPTGQQMGY